MTVPGLHKKQEAPVDGDPVALVAAIAVVPTILEVLCSTTGMGFAAVARVTEDRWIACGVRDTIGFGLAPGGELKIETTVCQTVRQYRNAVVIDDAATDPDWCGHSVSALYGIRGYISVPIILPDGSFFGTLCAVDMRPQSLRNEAVAGMFALFAELIAFHLDAQGRLAQAEALLAREREASVLRDQFIAVLGHDLRNPLASIEAGARLLRKAGLGQKGETILELMEQSTGRMGRLIGNVLDFARSRLGGGMALTRRRDATLAQTLAHVVSEHRTAMPERVIEAEIALHTDVNCDADRIGQLLSNLMGNALTHGASDRPMQVHAVTQGGELELSVVNAGVPIAPEAMEQMFQPFFRGRQADRAAGQEASRDGLGLGLYIASEIARAHGGRLEVESGPVQTRFTFRMPVGEAQAAG